MTILYAVHYLCLQCRYLSKMLSQGLPCSRRMAYMSRFNQGINIGLIKGAHCRGLHLYFTLGYVHFYSNCFTQIVDNNLPRTWGKTVTITFSCLACVAANT